ncbi:hypothetical protein NCU08555 [Neurospora crassa OR74A]|uniref:LrgB-like protein n=1 Tax=Neurospora crassa (strain ATCC 24698 / 74-OR23-1A / CBS 708.71 / DSM 1257 / FGSC 987) TaxID=367110 RepID=Q7SBJ6_NEUCR|nr:hypothetical protein NCU08555 [Neurospora crassa OR74A]EAA33801.2 hypothetical protein NCU08555 [Neurospora crassa OR74A]|eukprot:XP_963037.2 hypothetical protein NCU08555 [Neurospora crassa OR74A]
MCLFTSTTARQRYARLRHYLHKHTQLWDGVVATLLICMAQLAIAGIDLMLDNHSVDFPPSILAMVAVFVVLSACGCVLPRLEEFYQKHLSRATNLLNRHMSIGFTIPFVMICRGPLADARTVGLVIACFVVQETPRTGFRGWLSRNPILVLCWFLTFTVGIPLRYAVHRDAPLATFLLFATWFTMLEVQRAVKSAEGFAPWIRITLTGSLNAVLWTSLVMMGYIYIDAAISDRALGKMLDTLQTKTTLSHLLLHSVNGGVDAEGNKLNVSMAAGDIAQSILNAGLVAWGLKLYEYRRQLLSRAGLTVLIVSSILAIGNVALGPLLTRAIGLGPASRNIAYTARSVTIAMGAPVMITMGGDASLNATMVVISGIIFQMGLGFGLGSWLERTIFSCFVTQQDATVNTSPEQPEEKPEAEAKTEPKASQAELLTVPVRRSFDLEAAQRTRTTAPAIASPAQGEGMNDPHTVAAGLTIGINSAAMGTAYLYEVGSEAAPYSALSMMALGVMTVGFASIMPLAEWVVASVGGTMP